MSTESGSETSPLRGVFTIPLRLAEVNKWGKMRNRKIQPDIISCVVQCGKENISPEVKL